jgi:ribosome modulation factor
MTTSSDGRQFNNPHLAVYEKGRAAGEAGEGYESCPYRAPAMRNSWLRGYLDSAQGTLFKPSLKE